jgi:ABC-type branched-subunit amino acid transport system substrate-binding protein
MIHAIVIHAGEGIVKGLFKHIITFSAALIVFIGSPAVAATAEKGPSPAPKDPAIIKSSGSAMDPSKIGIILPLSGKEAPQGRRALDAILLGAEVFDSDSPMAYTLIIEDSQGHRDAAEKAVAKLADADGVICIIGPLGDSASEAAAKEAQRLKVPIITMNTARGITDAGDHVFRHFFTDKIQFGSLVKYAVGDLGMTRHAVVYPNSLYGREMAEIYKNEVLRQGGKMIAMQGFDVSQTDIAAEVKALTDEAAKQDKAIDALFLPVADVHIRQMASQRVFQKPAGIRLFGPSAWNNQDLVKAAGNGFEGALFADGFFLYSFYPEVNDFSDHYYAAFGREADFTDAIAFDTMKIIAHILGDRRVDTREKFRKALLKLGDYHGATGRTSFLEQRDAEKEAFILTIEKGRIIQVK